MQMFNKLVLCFVALCAALAATADVVISGTRAVYNGKDREITVRLTNGGKRPLLAQSWIDDGAAEQRPEEIKVPFTLTPPVARLDAGKGQSLRIAYTQEALPTDRESLFWLNVLEVPPKSKATGDDANTLQLAFRTRIKLFFRPVGLVGEASAAPALLTWQLQTDPADPHAVMLQVANPSPFHVSLAGIDVSAAGTKANAEAGMVAPHSQKQFALKGLKGKPAGPVTIDYHFINDFGGVVDGQTLLE
ncbi:fimbrial chaperone [Silvimonas sp. JCM 19000]